MNRYRLLALPAYLVAFPLIVIPATDATLTLWPWRVGVAQWRFGALGLFSNAFMIPCAGLLVAFVTALTLGHWRTLRVLGAACALLAVFTGLSILLFGLDAIQSSANVQDAARLSFKVASITAAAKMALATATFAAFAMTGLRSPREQRSVHASQPLMAARAREVEATPV